MFDNWWSTVKEVSGGVANKYRRPRCDDDGRAEVVVISGGGGDAKFSEQEAQSLLLAAIKLAVEQVGVDRYPNSSFFAAKQNFAGATTGDIIQNITLIDATTQAVIVDIWRNKDTGLDLASAPTIGIDIEYIGANGLTYEQLLTIGAAEEATLAEIRDRTPALGQALAAGSTPVVLTAAQLAALTPPAALTGFATETGNLADIKTNTDNLDVLKSTEIGTKITAATMPTGGTGYLGWLSGIWEQLNTKLQLGRKTSAESISVTTAIDSVTTGNITAQNTNSPSYPFITPTAGSYVEHTVGSESVVAIQVDGDLSTTALSILVSADGTNYHLLTQASVFVPATNTLAATLTTSPAIYLLAVGCYAKIRVMALSAVASGSAAITIKPGVHNINQSIKSIGTLSSFTEFGSNSSATATVVDSNNRFMSYIKGLMTSFGFTTDTSANTVNSTNSLMAIIKGGLTSLGFINTSAATAVNATNNLMAYIKGYITAFGFNADTAAAAYNTSNATLISLFKGLYRDLTRSSSYYSQTAGEKTEVKASAGVFDWFSVYNPNDYILYLQIFDSLAASVTLGTTTPTNQFMILPLERRSERVMIGFNTGLTYAITTTAGGSTAASVNFNLTYK